MKLHGEELRVGDIVFDVSASRGVGRVINITLKGAEVQFGSSGPRLYYGEDGAQLGRSRPTLFWRDPIILIPVKDEVLWRHQRDVATAVREALLGIRK